VLDDSIAMDTRLLRMQRITLGCQSKFQWKQVSVMSEDGVDSGGIGRIASVDFGTVRIGIAITDRQQNIASPLDNYRRQNDVQDGHYFRQLAAQEQISLFVVGLPIHLSGEESQKSLEAREFGKWLQNQTSVPVVFFDERFTTQMADEMLAVGGLTKKQRQGRRDKLAAQILLTAYLESGPMGKTDIRGLDDS
jgi:putative Holliday junction resolvase|tara:strand:- start:99 stop:677 length:579 start_codon:yes stop_codon:yes gene_type:complete